MDFLRNGKERAVLDNVRRVAQECVAPRAQATVGAADLVSENLADLYRHGIMGLVVREEYGGLGCGLHGNILVGALAVEELACACATTSQWFLSHNTALDVIYSLGAPAQQLRFSRAVLEACAQFTVQSEELGKSFLNIFLTARRIAGGYMLNGIKSCPRGSEGATWRLERRSRRRSARRGKYDGRSYSPQQSWSAHVFQTRRTSPI